MRLAIEFAGVDVDLFRETTVVYKPTSGTSNCLRSAKKKGTTADGKCSGSLTTYYYLSLWINHSGCQLISWVYFHILVMLAHKTGNGRLQLSRVRSQGLWTVLGIEHCALCKGQSLSEDGLKELYRKVTRSTKGM